MSPMQQIFLGLGAVAKKNYVDDIFSTYVYTGNSSARSINTGIDMTEDGLVWIKNRDQAYNNSLQDTVRGAGATKKLSSNLANGQNSGDNANHWAGYISAFNNNGFSVDKTGSGSIDWANYNKSGEDYASWTFRKAPGFCDIVSYTGNANARTISHQLGSVPGLIIIKNLDTTDHWRVYHRSLGATEYLNLNSASSAGSGNAIFNNTEPTASVFSVGTSESTNKLNSNFIAYLFAGGESTAATARSVDFDGNDALTSATSSDLSFGTGDYTVEFWCKFNATPNDSPLFENRLSGSPSDATGFTITAYGGTNGVRIWWNGASRINGGAADIQGTGKWHHIAATRSSGTTYLFLDGTLLGTTTDSINITTNEAHIAGGKYSGSSSLSHYFNGKISNFRIVKGTAVYTSSFKPSYEPLTNITNTKLLCCNNSSTTGSTVAPGTITAVGDPTASTDSPFDDPAAHVFGESGSESVIKCGSYVGNGSSGLGPVINLGWEPQYVLIKNSSSGSNSWNIWDSMRGIVTGGNDIQLYTDRSQEEYTGADRVDLTPTGFKLKQNNSLINTDGDTYIYMCIRRPDGYVGKPPELGTGVFNIDLAGINAGDPSWVSGFPVDMQFIKDRNGTTYNFYLSTRLTQGKYLSTTSNAAETANSVYSHDYQNGWGNYSSSDAELITSWMWKRHAGFDVVTYKGNGVARQIPHSLSKVPEMIWVKRRDSARTWGVYHKGLNGGTNPEQYAMYLDTTQAANSSSQWNNTAHTAINFSLGTSTTTNNSSGTYIAMLFASTDVSKVGSYTGNGSTGQTISTGFAPRFVIIRKYNDAANWLVLDTTRGWGSGNDKYILLNSSGAQGDYEVGAPVSNGFTLVGDNDYNNSSGAYIYYAHA